MTRINSCYHASKSNKRDLSVCPSHSRFKGLRRIEHVAIPKSLDELAYSILLLHIYGGFPKSWVPFWGAHKKVTVFWGPILGSPYLAKLPDIYTYIHECEYILHACRQYLPQLETSPMRSRHTLRMSCRTLQPVLSNEKTQNLGNYGVTLGV